MTLNLGLRYNLCTFPREVRNHQSNFNLSTLTLQQAGTHGLSANVVQTNENNFVPGFGFGFACGLPGDGKTPVCGGYGIYYFLDRGGAGNQLSENPDLNGSANCSDLPNQGGYRLDFAGAAPACPTLTGRNEDLPASQGALPLPVFGAMVHRADPIYSGLISIDTSSQHLSNWLIVNSQELNTAPDPTRTDGNFGKITSVRLLGTPTAALTALDVPTHLQPAAWQLSAAVRQSSLFIPSRVCARSQKSA